MIVKFALIGWPLLSVLFFAMLRPRLAVLATIFGGWLLLPMSAIFLPGLPDLTKVEAVSLGLILGVCIFHPNKITQYKPRWFDAPVLILTIVAPLCSSILNGLGIYDGASEALVMLMFWGVPYFVGRLYFKTQEDLLYLTKGMFVAGLMYTPLVLFEIRFSPQLHAIVYGFHQHRFDQVMRFGMYRPMVFVQHGLMLATWMAMATLCGYWLWFNGHLKRVGPVPAWLVVGFMFAIVILCVSTGSIMLMLIGVVLLHASLLLRTRVLALLLVLAVPGYMLVRGTSLWDGSEAIDAARLIDPGRSASLRTRIEAENHLVDHAQKQITFGWAGHNRYRPLDVNNQRVIADGLWTLYFAKHGLVGLLSLTGILLIPALLVIRRGNRVWRSREFAAPAVLCTVTILFAIDCLPNAMVSPPYLLAGGALATVFASARATRAKADETEPAPAGITA